MIKFRMYAEFADGFSGYYQRSAETVDEAEALCMSDIADDIGEDGHGDCVYYEACEGYDEQLDGYWVNGEWFDGFDENEKAYYKI